MAITADQQKMVDELRSVGWTGQVPSGLTGRKLTQYLNLQDDAFCAGQVKAIRAAAPKRSPGRPKGDKPALTSAERAARSKERQRARIDLCLAAPGECTDPVLLAETLVHALKSGNLRSVAVHARLGQLMAVPCKKTAADLDWDFSITPELIDAHNAATQN